MLNRQEFNALVLAAWERGDVGRLLLLKRIAKIGLVALIFSSAACGPEFVMKKPCELGRVDILVVPNGKADIPCRLGMGAKRHGPSMMPPGRENEPGFVGCYAAGDKALVTELDASTILHELIHAIRSACPDAITGGEPNQ